MLILHSDFMRAVIEIDIKYNLFGKLLKSYIFFRLLYYSVFIIS